MLLREHVARARGELAQSLIRLPCESHHTSYACGRGGRGAVGVQAARDRIVERMGGRPALAASPRTAIAFTFGCLPCTGSCGSRP